MKIVSFKISLTGGPLDKKFGHWESKEAYEEEEIPATIERIDRGHLMFESETDNSKLLYKVTRRDPKLNIAYADYAGTEATEELRAP